MQSRQVCLLFCLLAAAAHRLPQPLCPDQKNIFSGSTASGYDYCSTLVKWTFKRRHDENWAVHFAKECQKLFMEPKIERWPFQYFPLKAGMFHKNEYVLYSSLTILEPTVTLINGVYYQLRSRSADIIIFTIHDAATREEFAQCSYTYNKNKGDWVEAYDLHDNCHFFFDGITKIGTIRQEWRQFCLKIKLDRGVHSHPQFMWYYTEKFEFFDCFDNRDRSTIAALCRHPGLKHCHDLEYQGRCKTCDEGWAGQLCTLRKGEICKRYPCGSYGKCTPLKNDAFSCKCETNHTGPFCEIEIDACSSAPCKNGGWCTTKKNYEYSCECGKGYRGKNCQISNKKCDKVCLNGGSCRETVKGFACQCAHGYTGESCDKAVKKTSIRHCPSDAGPFGGERLDIKMCLSRAACTFAKHHTTNWVKHFQKECHKEYGPPAGIYAWLPTDPLASAVTLKNVMDLRFPKIHLTSPTLLNGLYFKIFSIERNVIKAHALIGLRETSLAECIFTLDKMGKWSSLAVSGMRSFCEFHESTLQDLNSVQSDWKTFCLYLNIMNHVGLTEEHNWAKGNIRIIECINDGQNLDLVTLCIHNPSKHCIDFQFNVGCKKCRNEMEGQFCTIDSRDPCNKIPCGSYGSCKSQGGKNYQCICEKGSFGNKCQYTKNPCDDKPCSNGGKCKDVDRSYVCVCSVGYTGPQCRDDINECNAKVCKNGGTCINTIGSYQCECPDGFEGKNCETEKDDCRPNPCKNGGYCADLVNDFRCRCKSGYTGKTCDMDLNECESDPCKNGGTCENRENSYFCWCKPGFTGVQCNGATAFCDTYTCLNGGTCKVVNAKTECYCSKSFTGKRCEIEVVLCTDGICGPGICIQEAIDFKCDCNQTGFEGSRCQRKIDECILEPCGTNGICVDEINGYRCMCKSGFTGPRCDTVMNPCITENPCRNGGSCTWEKEELKCICPNELTGEFCTELNHISSVKSVRTGKIDVSIWFIVVPICIMSILVTAFGVILVYRRKRSKRHKYSKHSLTATGRGRSSRRTWGKSSGHPLKYRSRFSRLTERWKHLRTNEKESFSKRTGTYIQPNKTHLKVQWRRSSVKHSRY